MWQQPTMGHYTDGTEQLTIQMNALDNWIVWKNEAYDQEFNSLEQLNDYLAQKGLEPLYLPQLSNEVNIWYAYAGDEHYTEVYARKRDNGEVQSVVLAQFKDGRFGVFSRANNYTSLEYLIETSLEFAKVHLRNPKDDLELDAYDITTHGSSGMDQQHYPLTNEDEARNVLKNYYDIP